MDAWWATAFMINDVPKVLLKFSFNLFSQLGPKTCTCPSKVLVPFLKSPFISSPTLFFGRKSTLQSPVIVYLTAPAQLSSSTLLANIKVVFNIVNHFRLLKWQKCQSRWWWWTSNSFVPNASASKSFFFLFSIFTRFFDRFNRIIFFLLKRK